MSRESAARSAGTGASVGWFAQGGPPTASVCHDVAWLTSDRRFPGEWRFNDLAMIAMAEAETERGGKTSIERRYYLSSASLSAKRFAQAMRAHWHAENRVHRSSCHNT